MTFYRYRAERGKKKLGKDNINMRWPSGKTLTQRSGSAWFDPRQSQTKDFKLRGVGARRSGLQIRLYLLLLQHKNMYTRISIGEGPRPVDDLEVFNPDLFVRSTGGDRGGDVSLGFWSTDSQSDCDTGHTRHHKTIPVTAKTTRDF
ncbi:hypothetical protein ElyMa_004884500 [Elysia marginata]|uniref:Uncharacterized protein n=1 Tax=Elysia marginata TaxID=1093978 RepID=A0AAV4IUW4_9GAST|nr:hypothetical protein ElyMa_004884500 [Elysia marginata]